MARATAAEVSAELGGAIPAADVHEAWLDDADEEFVFATM